MSQPAARLGDMTAHGGVVTTGNPTVLINGQPAAAVGDLHVCPMCSPGPHVGGPLLAGAPTVLIGGKPAGRVGDACTCAAPAPDVIVSGSSNVFIGGGGGAGSPGAAAAVASAHGATLDPATRGLGTTARPLEPWVGVVFADPAGFPVTAWRYRAEAGAEEREGQVGSGGQIWLDALAEKGSVQVELVGVYGCRWARDHARVGDEVTVSARCVGVADGEIAHVEVWRETPTSGGAVERAAVWEQMAEVAGGRVETKRPFVFVWPESAAGPARVSAEAAPPPPSDAPPSDTPPSDEAASPVAEGDSAAIPDLADPHAQDEGTTHAGSASETAGGPVFYAEVVVGGLHRARSGPLRFQDWVPVRVRTPSGDPIGGAEFRLVTSAGEVRSGTTGRDGTARVEDVPPGPYQVTIVRTPGAPASQQQP